MKKIALVFALAAICSTVNAKTTTCKSPATAVAPTEDDAKTKVDPATLPDAVKKVLAGDAYKEWKVSNAWSVKAEPMYYTIELKKEDKTNTVNIDANGVVK